MKHSSSILCGLMLVIAASWALAQNALRETPTGQPEGSRAQVAYLKRAACFNALRGPGATITLRDRDVTDASRVVHDYDLLLVINQLRAAQAEAIALNGVRVGNHCSIRVVGPEIRIDDKALDPPFVIHAIGDGPWFQKIMRTSGLSQSFGEAGPQMSVALSDDVRVPALEAAPSFRFARPE